MSFYGDTLSSKYCNAAPFTWYRGPENRPVTFFTDLCLSYVDWAKDTYKIAWLIEPVVINSGPYEYIVENYNKFDMILTHHTDLLKLSPKVKYYAFGGTWVKPTQWEANCDKSKAISIIASNKNYAPGHTIRHKVIKAAKQHLDVYGTGYNPIDDKYDALAPYYFSVAIENCSVSDYFTEKLIDCFATKTVPIYYGPSEIGKFFNKDGIIQCKNEEEIVKYIESLQKPFALKEQYIIRREMIEDNFQRAQQYISAEHYIYKHILVPNNLV